MLHVGVCWAMVLKEGYDLERNQCVLCSYGLERSQNVPFCNGLERNDQGILHVDLTVCPSGHQRSQFHCKCCYIRILLSMVLKEVKMLHFVMVLKGFNLYRADNGLERSKFEEFLCLLTAAHILPFLLQPHNLHFHITTIFCAFP